DEERGPEANEKQLKKLLTATKKLTALRLQIGKLEEKLKKRPKSGGKTKLEKSHARLREGVKRELHRLEVYRPLQTAVINEMRRLLTERRLAHSMIQHYEEATGRTKNQLIREAGEAEDRRHVLKVNGTRENLLDIAVRIKDAQKSIRDNEQKVKASTDEFAHSIEIIASRQYKSRRAKKELTEANLHLI